MDITRGEAVEHELDAMIRRRHETRVVSEGERPLLEAWQESERKHAERQRELNRIAWCDYFERIAAHHRREIERYEQLLNINHKGDDAA